MTSYFATYSYDTNQSCFEPGEQSKTIYLDATDHKFTRSHGWATSSIIAAPVIGASAGASTIVMANAISSLSQGQDVSNAEAAIFALSGAMFFCISKFFKSVEYKQQDLIIEALNNHSEEFNKHKIQAMERAQIRFVEEMGQKVKNDGSITADDLAQLVCCSNDMLHHKHGEDRFEIPKALQEAHEVGKRTIYENIGDTVKSPIHLNINISEKESGAPVRATSDILKAVAKQEKYHLDDLKWQEAFKVTPLKAATLELDEISRLLNGKTSIEVADDQKTYQISDVEHYPKLSKLKEYDLKIDKRSIYLPRYRGLAALLNQNFDINVPHVGPDPS